MTIADPAPGTPRAPAPGTPPTPVKQAGEPRERPVLHAAAELVESDLLVDDVSIGGT